MIHVGGRELLIDILTSSAGLPDGSLTEENPSLLEVVAGTSLADLESTLSTRAYLVLGCGLLLVVFAALMRSAATWAMVTLSAALAVVFSGVIVAGNGITASALVRRVH